MLKAVSEAPFGVVMIHALATKFELILYSPVHSPVTRVRVLVL